MCLWRYFNGGMKKMRAVRTAIPVVLICLSVAVRAYSFTGDLKDGTYEGEYSFVKAEVTVEGGEVTGIKVLRHGGGGEKYAEMIYPLAEEMAEKGTTDVDAVTGATVSSENLKRAVKDALRKASE
ncbi:MAG: FMN-binding protein [Candidatus Omnitrophica bacterium]|nr:FMN-binding protein [Candidatus Omnitrophota bacterium]